MPRHPPRGAFLTLQGPAMHLYIPSWCTTPPGASSRGAAGSGERAARLLALLELRRLATSTLSSMMGLLVASVPAPAGALLPPPLLASSGTDAARQRRAHSGECIHGYISHGYTMINWAAASQQKLIRRHCHQAV